MKKVLPLLFITFFFAGCSTIFKVNHQVTIETSAESDFEKSLIVRSEKMPIRKEDLSASFISIHAEDGTKIWNQWWDGVTDGGTKIAYTVNEDAVNYYKKHSMGLRFGKRSEIGAKLKSSNFHYKSSVEFHDDYRKMEHEFKNVYVVKLEIDWQQYCDSLCSAGWNRVREFVFSQNGELIEIIEPEEKDELFILISEYSNKQIESNSYSLRESSCLI